MDFSYSPRTQDLQQRVSHFMAEHVYPNEARYHAELEANTAAGKRWTPLQVIEDLKPKARAAGLWNLFLPPRAEGAAGHGSAVDASHLGAGLNNQEYAPLAEIMGAVPWSSEVFNCSAPDTGNMEVLVRYGTPKHHQRWLEPLLRGEIRSAFAMTEPAVASSDATNIEARIERVSGTSGDEYVINGRKWWSTNMGHPNVAISIVMGKTDTGAATHQQQSQILVPTNTPGFRIERMLTVFGYDERPIGHAEVVLDNVRVPVENLIAGEGRGFEIAQGRLGPGRIHHCMRVIGVAERALELMTQRLLYELKGARFLQVLTTLTGIENLIPDALNHGGGIHMNCRGALLKIHADFNRHPQWHVDRRLNLLLYLNEGWQTAWGGDLELWSADMQACLKKIAPVAGRCVIFSTSSTSFHGHPEPIDCPEDVSRKSIALYYYSNPPRTSDEPVHSTLWQARPGLE